MKCTAILTDKQISDAFNEYSASLYRYIMYKVNDDELAKDMVQDAFLKLLGHRGEVRIDNVKSLLYATVHNIIIDYVRRREKYSEIMSEYFKGYDETYTVEEKINADEIAHLEKVCLKRLPPQRRRVYTLHRFNEKSSDEIALCLNVSKKTVENHLLASRKEVRGFLKKCI